MSTGNVGTQSVHVEHHYRDAAHQHDSAKQGVWLFMVTEILMFGALIMGYLIFHTIYPDMFAEGAKFLDWKMGFLNTVVLLFSSFTMAMGVYFAQTNQQSKTVAALATTVACGGIFMIVKYFEYTDKISHGLMPGKFFTYENAEAANLALYFSFYYCLTGLHGIHVLIGMSLITWVLIRAKRGEFSSGYYTPVEGVGIFWHVVDLIWIYLFPMLYLIG